MFTILNKASYHPYKILKSYNQMKFGGSSTWSTWHDFPHYKWNEKKHWEKNFCLSSFPRFYRYLKQLHEEKHLQPNAFFTGWIIISQWDNFIEWQTWVEKVFFATSNNHIVVKLGESGLRKDFPNGHFPALWFDAHNWFWFVVSGSLA